QCLPVPMFSRNDFSVWSVLKNSIGKELSKIAMPVVFNEPLSFLQRMVEYMEYAHLLQEASSKSDPVERLQVIDTSAQNTFQWWSANDSKGPPSNSESPSQTPKKVLAKLNSFKVGPFKSQASISEYYQFTLFAMSLNEMEPGMEKKLCPTDCRLRPDIKKLENGDLDGAAAEKNRLEEQQRDARKARKGKKNGFVTARIHTQGMRIGCIPAATGIAISALIRKSFELRTSVRSELLTIIIIYRNPTRILWKVSIVREGCSLNASTSTVTNLKMAFSRPSHRFSVDFECARPQSG
ncbi:unnamed protein product, partial [Nesidiocoris tenuis]